MTTERSWTMAVYNAMRDTNIYGPKRPVRVATRGNVTYYHPDDFTADTAQQRIDEWMSTFVSKYNLPKRVNRARKAGQVKAPIPLEALDALIARVELARGKGQKSLQVGTETVAGFLEEVGIAA